MQLTDRHREYWRKNLRITGILLAIWFVVTYVVGFYARDLNFNFFGWPFSFNRNQPRGFQEAAE
jgi:putative solute:sodium symporter small subunit